MKKSFFANQNYIRELNKVEHSILGINVALSLIFFIVQLSGLKAYNQGSAGLAFFASIVSIFSVMAGAKQRVICPLLGIIASIFLIFVNGNAKNYLMMIMYALNIFMQLSSFIIGLKGSNDKISINPRHAKGGICLIYFIVMVGFIAFFSGMDGQQGGLKFGTFGLKEVTTPTMAERIFDACALVFMIGCLYPQLKKYDQVGYVYILNDAAMLIQGTLKAAYAKNNVDLFTALTMIVSIICMTITCIIGLINGKRVEKNSKQIPPSLLIK